ncbi:MAG: hypothetical protein IIA41_01460 [SAR324 cluster bacterium]|nr:hypothetical protein [SAR324 cluster bacterium]
MMRFLYGWVLLPAAFALALAIAPLHRKLRRSLLARRGVWARLEAARAERDPARPLVWFHVASAGELLQAEPVIRRCGAAGAQVAVTVTSASGMDWADRFSGMDGNIWTDAMPLDFPWALGRIWAALRPSALVNLQAELWPGVVYEAAARGTPQLLIAARIGADSSRIRSAWGRAFYRPLYRAMTAILALSEEDRERISRLVPEHPALETGGDPGIETALTRVREAVPAELPPDFTARAGTILVVGSSWSADEAHLLPVLREALNRIGALRCIVAPHEPTEAHLTALETALGPWGTVRLSAGAQTGGEPRAGAPPRVVLVDSVGRLASLYSAGHLAYVGGGFSTGVHNVAEPAAAGLPVLFGPRNGNSAVAQELLAEGAAFAVEDAGSLGLTLLPLLADAARTAELGARAQALVTEMGGAAELAYRRIRAALPTW